MMNQTIETELQLASGAALPPPADDVLEEILRAAGLEPLDQTEAEQ